MLEVLLGQLAQRDLTQLGDDMLIDGTLIGVLRGGAETGLDVGLIPEVHPFAEGHIGTDLLGLGAAHCFHQLDQFFLTLMLGLGQHIFRFGQSFVVIAHHGPTFPAVVLALPYGAGAYAAAKLQSNRSSPTPRPLKSDTLSAGPTVGVVSVETGLFVSLHAA